MPLQVLEVEKADVPLLEPLRVAAFQNNPIEPFLFPRKQQAMSAEEISNKERERAGRATKEWEANPFMKIFKVIDTDLDNEMIAFAQFLVYKNDEEAKEKLYTKLGYTEVEVLEFDIWRWGGDVDPQRMKFMQREPRH